MCKIGKWRCPYIDPYMYFVIVNEEGEEVGKSFKKAELQAKLKKGQKIEIMILDSRMKHLSEKIQSVGRLND